MVDIANKFCVLKLNSAWQVIGYTNVKKALISLVGNENVKALDINYKISEDGQPDFSEQPDLNIVSWDEWKTLPIRPWELSIHSLYITIRVPTVIIDNNFSSMPMKYWRGKPSKEAIYERDGGVCMYSGQHLSRKEASVDHVIPKSRGGTDDWTNLALSSRLINSKKGNKLNSEIGLKLLRKPTVPKPIPISALVREIKHRDWRLFIKY